MPHTTSDDPNVPEPLFRKPRIASVRKAAGVRWHPDDYELAAQLDGELRASNLAQTVEQIVATAPELTPEQRLHLVGLIIGGGR